GQGARVPRRLLLCQPKGGFASRARPSAAGDARTLLVSAGEAGIGGQPDETLAARPLRQPWRWMGRAIEVAVPCSRERSVGWSSRQAAGSDVREALPDAGLEYFDDHAVGVRAQGRRVRPRGPGGRGPQVARAARRAPDHRHRRKAGRRAGPASRTLLPGASGQEAPPGVAALDDDVTAAVTRNGG